MPVCRSRRREENHPDSLQGRREPGFRALKIRSFVAENAPQDDRFVVVLNEGRTWIWVPVILSVSEEAGGGFTRIK